MRSRQILGVQKVQYAGPRLPSPCEFDDCLVASILTVPSALCHQQGLRTSTLCLSVNIMSWVPYAIGPQAHGGQSRYILLYFFVSAAGRRPSKSQCTIACEVRLVGPPTFGAVEGTICHSTRFAMWLSFVPIKELGHVGKTIPTRCLLPRTRPCMR